MGEFVYLRDLVIIFFIAVIVVSVLHRLKIPSIAAFILSGMLVGPRGLGLINDVHQVEVLAEVGVAILLFGIGLELSLNRVRMLFKPILFGGFVQVSLSIGAAFAAATALNLPWNTSLFIGFIVAISSTAIVLRGLETRGEIDAPHGRLTLGILIFQDLCVVPMMLIIPLLSGETTSGSETALILGKAVAVVVGVLLASRLIVPFVLRFIAKTRQRELFIMTVLLVCIGTAWLTSLAGVSLALGAFLAGMVVAGSEYRHQALSDMISFKDIFTSLFFISVGMLLVPISLVENALSIIILLAVVIAGKFIIVFLTAWIMRLPLRVAVLAGVSLAQIGEFSFLLIGVSRGTGLLDETVSVNLIAVAILSMFLTPFFLTLGPRIAAGAVRIRVLGRLLGVRDALDAEKGGRVWQDHVIIGGYGFTGEEISRILRECSVDYLIAEMNPENIIRAESQGDTAFYGDITSREVLERLGIEHAREFIVVINDPAAGERAVRTARSMAPDLHIVVRTRYVLEVEPLLKAGASEVVAAEKEAADKIAEMVVDRCNYPGS